MTQKVSNREARGVVTPLPENPTEIAPSAPTDGPISTTVPSPIVEVEQADTDDLHSGRMTKFIPAADFDGYPDGKTKTTYVKGVEAEAPSRYVKLLKSKGHAE